MFFLLRALMIAMTFTISTSAFASEEHSGGEKKEEKKEEKKGEGKEEKKEEKPKGDTWNVVSAKVSALEAKVKAGQEEIEKLIEEKSKTSEPAKVDAIIKQIVTAHKALEANVKEYDQQRAFLRYRFPEKGMVGEREYERIEVKSIEEMENEMSLGSSVKRTLKKVRTQYETPADKKARFEREKEQSVEKEHAQPTKSIIEPVILQK